MRLQITCDPPACEPTQQPQHLLPFEPIPSRPPGLVRGGGGLLGGAAAVAIIALEPMTSPLAMQPCVMTIRHQIAAIQEQRGALLGHLAALQGMLGQINADCPMRADCLRRRKQLLDRLAAAIAELQDYIRQLDEALPLLWTALSRCEQGIEQLPGVGNFPTGVRHGAAWSWIGAAHVHSFDRAIRAFNKACQCNFSLVPAQPVYVNE